MPRLMSFSKTIRQIREGTKTVTRRDGWRFLKVGDAVEGIEWSAWVGGRWACENCGWNGTQPKFQIGKTEYITKCAGCGAGDGYLVRRLPQRLGLFRVVSVRRERLGDITQDDVAREGFPDLTPAEFVELYCSPKSPDPDREVTRIEFCPVGASEDPAR